MPSLTRRGSHAGRLLSLVDVPLVRRFGEVLRPISKPGTYRVAQCQMCAVYHGFSPLEAGGLMPKQRECVCGGQVRVTPDYCRVKA